MADGNPFGNPYAQQPAPQQDPYAASPYGRTNGNMVSPQQQQYGQQPPNPGFQQQSVQQGQGYDPFASQGPQQYSNALVPSQQPSNPYAGVATPQGQPNIPGSYDPFSAPPPAASQAMVPMPPNEGNPYGAPPYQQQYQQQPYGQQQPPPQQAPPPPPRPAPASPSQASSPPASRPVNEVAIVPAASSGYPGAPSTPRQPVQEKEDTTPAGTEARNKYSAALAQNAPMGASPLPRADMVRKTGYVLSRISFRTIVMKKWKQSFWVQYGPHTMLWFRSQADFDDWLNNPYHSQAQRNFLIKLAVNFAHDLYKPNVRGYQVTQCRTKSYGTKLIRQFKLERWMDYGPTIAAAFGSNNPKEVDDLREALVACMRNTPLNGGIRATGAVRERSEQGYEQHAQSEGGMRPSPGGGFESNSYAGHQNFGRPTSRSVASAGEMMGDQKGFDDNNSDGGLPAAPAPPPDLLDFTEPVQQQQSFAQSAPPHQYPPPPGQYPPQQQQYGAPPPQQQYPGPPPPGQYPVQQQPYGANPHMQQQYTPAQGQSYGGY